MKAFEEWVQDHSRVPGAVTGPQEVWRAVLEWVMSKNHEDALWIGDDTHDNTYDIILTDDIRQELEN